MREHKGSSIISLPLNYIVIDTETTGLDYEYCHIIEVSALKYLDGKLVDTFTSLVQPPLQQIYSFSDDDDDGKWVSYYVDDFITDITGITNEMLASAPMPSEVFPKLSDFIGNSLLIAHNAHFDINFLYDSFLNHCTDPLTNDFIDTLRIARKVFPNLRHHRLSDVASACGVSQQMAHRAEADCIVTAQCYEAMRQTILSTQTEDAFKLSFAKKKKKYKDVLFAITAEAKLKNTHEVNTCSSILSGLSISAADIDETNPIFGKTVVFTGALSSMPRKEAFQLVAEFGGVPENSITTKTNFLVIGNSEFAKSVKDGKTTKMKKAESYIKKGYEISIISETAFFDLISNL